MKLLAVGLAAVAGPACAFSFGPTTTTINGTGVMFMGALSCPATGVRFQTTAAGDATLTAFNPIRCPDIVFSNLPWRMVAKNQTAGVAQRAAWTTPQGVCGPLSLKLTVSNGLVTFHGGGTAACGLKMTATTIPALQIEATGIPGHRGRGQD